MGRSSKFKGQYKQNRYHLVSQRPPVSEEHWGRHWGSAFGNSIPAQEEEILHYFIPKLKVHRIILIYEKGRGSVGRVFAWSPGFNPQHHTCNLSNLEWMQEEQRVILSYTVNSGQPGLHKTLPEQNQNQNKIKICMYLTSACVCEGGHRNTFEHVYTCMSVCVVRQYIQTCILESSASQSQRHTMEEQDRAVTKGERRSSLTVSHMTMYTSVLKELFMCWVR